MDAFNQERALVVIVKTSWTFVSSSTIDVTVVAMTLDDVYV